MVAKYIHVSYTQIYSCLVACMSSLPSQTGTVGINKRDLNLDHLYEKESIISSGEENQNTVSNAPRRIGSYRKAVCSGVHVKMLVPFSHQHQPRVARMYAVPPILSRNPARSRACSPAARD